MSEHVSFFEQAAGDTGGKPDIAVHLPNEGHIPIDSKFPLHAFLEGIETIDDEVRRVKFGEHARAMRETVRELSRKSYWKQFTVTRVDHNVHSDRIMPDNRIRTRP